MTKTGQGPGGGPELLVELDRGAELALHEQIERSLRDQIRSGRLAAQARLPSTRSLAAELGVSRGVVTEAYGQLAAEGYLTTSQGAPVRVARAVRAAASRAPARSLFQSYPYNFHPGLPDLAGFPREAWLRSVRAALRDSPLDSLGYGDPRGVPVCAKRWRVISAACVVPTRTRRTSLSAPDSCRASRCCVVPCAAAVSSGWRSRTLAGMCTG